VKKGSNIRGEMLQYDTKKYKCRFKTDKSITPSKGVGHNKRVICCVLESKSTSWRV
jgi:hypothetical protein